MARIWGVVRVQELAHLFFEVIGLASGVQACAGELAHGLQCGGAWRVDLFVRAAGRETRDQSLGSHTAVLCPDRVGSGDEHRGDAVTQRRHCAHQLGPGGEQEPEGLGRRSAVLGVGDAAASNHGASCLDGIDRVGLAVHPANLPGRAKYLLHRVSTLDECSAEPGAVGVRALDANSRDRACRFQRGDQSGVAGRVRGECFGEDRAALDGQDREGMRVSMGIDSRDQVR